jgi:hypothetical protein
MIYPAKTKIIYDTNLFHRTKSFRTWVTNLIRKFLSFMKSKDYYGTVFTLRNIIISFRHLNYFLTPFSASVCPEFIFPVSQSHKHKLPRQCSEHILHTCHKHHSAGKTVKFQCHPTRVHCLVYANFSYPTYLNESIFLTYNSQQNKTQSTDDWGTLCSQILEVHIHYHNAPYFIGCITPKQI